MSGMVNTIVKNYFEVDLNFHPIWVIRFRNSDPGMASWYRKFIPHFAEIIEPVNRLLKKNKKCEW